MPFFDRIADIIRQPARAVAESARLHRRIDKLKQINAAQGRKLADQIARTRQDAALLKKRVDVLGRPVFYDNLKMFTYLMDKDCSVDQKRWFIEKQFTHVLRYFPDLDNPRSFNEKTQWYKLNYRDPLMTTCIDKYAFKAHVADRIGGRYVTPLVGVWDRAAQVDFDSLPDRFVIKSNWGSGGRHVLPVRDKAGLDPDMTRLRVNEWVQPWENVYYHTFDWGYKNIKPRLLAETFVTGKRLEYKFFCFDGQPVHVCVAVDSLPGLRNTRNYYDMNWTLLPFTKKLKNSDFDIPKPPNFDEMLEIARELSRPFPHVRVDMCDTETGLLVEELTFYTHSGTGRFDPLEWDFRCGEPFNLPAPTPEPPITGIASA